MKITVNKLATDAGGSDNRASVRVTAEEWTRALVRMVLRLAIYTLIVVSVVYALGRLKAVIVSLFVAAILAYVMRPMAGWLAHRRLVITRRKSMHVRRVEAT